MINTIRRFCNGGALLGFCGSVGVHAVRYSGADCAYQYSTQQKIDSIRAAKFVNFGVVIGGVYFFIYGPIYSGVMKKLPSRIAPAAMVFLDYNITSHIVYFPIYYLTEEWVEATRFSPHRALIKCHNNRSEDWMNLWKFAPLGWVNYTYVPTEHRGTFSGCCGFIWALYLSHSRGDTTKRDE